jgi:glycosyltransferase involved in cell wall biosynthesis
LISSSHKVNDFDVDDYSTSWQPTQYTVSVVVPTLNEAENLPGVLSRIPDFVDEVVVVDGQSQDDTVEIAQKVCPTAKIVFQRNRGKGDALRCGFACAQGDIIVQIDADGSMDPAEIEKFATTVNEGYDIVKGSRYLFGGGSTDFTPQRSFGNRMFVMLVNLLFSAKYTDLCYGYMAFRRDALKRLAGSLESDGFQIETEICIKAKKIGLRIAEVPSFEGERVNGNSRLSVLRDGFRILRMIIVEFLRSRNRM